MEGDFFETLIFLREEGKEDLSLDTNKLIKELKTAGVIPYESSVKRNGNTSKRVYLGVKRVNGGTIGLPDRLKHFKEYYSLLA